MSDHTVLALLFSLMAVGLPFLLGYLTLGSARLDVRGHALQVFQMVNRSGRRFCSTGWARWFGGGGRRSSGR